MASKIIDYIQGFFKCFNKTAIQDNSFSYEHNNCFQYFFNILEKSNDVFMIPAFLYDETRYCKSTNVPIQINNRETTDLSETTLLSTLGKRWDYFRNYHLEKLRTKSGEVYYGTNGIILDSEFRILIMVVLKVISNNIVDVICYINPKIYNNEKGTAEKIIIKKIMPFICLNLVSVNYRHIGAVTAVFKDVTSQYIIKPTEPGEEFCDDYANNLLINWEDIILDYLGKHFNEQED